MEQPSREATSKSTQVALRNILASPMVSDIIRGLRIESRAVRLSRCEALQESVVKCLSQIARMDEFDYLRIGEHGEAATKQTFNIGDLVSVTPRCFPGSNKEGGVGTVIQIDQTTGTYKVKYSLGGTEKGLASHFLKLHVFEHEVVETISRRRSLGRSNSSNSGVSLMATPPRKGAVNEESAKDTLSEPPKTLTEIENKLDDGKYIHINWTDRPDYNDVHPLPQTIDFTLLMSDFDNLCCQALKLHEATAATAGAPGKDPLDSDDDECMHRGNPVYETQLIRQRGTELLVSAMRGQETILSASIAQDTKDAETVCFGGRRAAIDPALAGLGKGKSRTEALRSGPRAGDDSGGKKPGKKPQTQAPYIDIDVAINNSNKKSMSCQIKWDGWSGSNVSKNKRQMVAPASFVKVLAKRTKMPVVEQGQLLLSLMAQLTEHEMNVGAF